MRASRVNGVEYSFESPLASWLPGAVGVGPCVESCAKVVESELFEFPMSCIEHSDEGKNVYVLQ